MSDLLRLFTRAAKLLREATDAAMAEHGVRVGQNIVLEALWESDGLTPGELAARQRLSTPTVVQTATRMEAVGLLERRSDPADGRLVRLYLTARGRAVRGAVRRARAGVARRATARLDADEARALNAALAKIVAELEAQVAGRKWPEPVAPAPVAPHDAKPISPGPPTVSLPTKPTDA